MSRFRAPPAPRVDDEPIDLPWPSLRAPAEADWGTSAAALAIPSELAFLRTAGIDPVSIYDALERSLDLGMPAQTVIVRGGYVPAELYTYALAQACRLPVIGSEEVDRVRLRRSFTDRAMQPEPEKDGSGQFTPSDGILTDSDGIYHLVLDPMAWAPQQLVQIVRSLHQHGVEPAFAAPGVLREVVERDLGPTLAARAAFRLKHDHPEASAANGIANWQFIAATGGLGLATGAALIVPDEVRWILLAVLSLPFLVMAMLRLAALAHVLVAQPPMVAGTTLADHALPEYTVLVPLFREARVLPGLVRALAELDYPPEKLDIKLILEAGDAETIDFAQDLQLDARFELIIVPPGQPRTKPRALNYALNFARGSLVTVFDAEDIPDPNQLRLAAQRFHSAPPGLGCLQGRLTIDNGDQNWLARQFSIEYLALFDAFLPALQRMNLPLPLGGTSNHFARNVLDHIGGWDPHNVTEDADLGLRLARHGYRVEVLATRTYEEAPIALWPWLKQRTRWMKGYLQTASVHMRRPSQTLRELGWRRLIGSLVVVGGVALSALALPVFIAGLLFGALHGGLWHVPESTIARIFFWLAVLNLCVGWTAPMLLSLAAILKTRRFELLMSWPGQPLYWMLMSLAAWRALLQLWREPYIWEKTEHGMGRRRTARSRRLDQRQIQRYRR